MGCTPDCSPLCFSSGKVCCCVANVQLACPPIGCEPDPCYSEERGICEVSQKMCCIIRRFSSRPVRTLELDVVDSAAAGLPTMGRTLMLQPPPMVKHEQLLLLVDLSLRRSASGVDVVEWVFAGLPMTGRTPNKVPPTATVPSHEQLLPPVDLSLRQPR